MPATSETVFTWGAPPIKFGPGAADELGHDLGQLDVRRVLLLTDPGVADTGTPHRIAEHIRAAGLMVEIFDKVHVEPTDASLREAIAFATGSTWDGFVAVGGGSAIDTAKAVNLMTSHPGGDLIDYVNAPIGGGKAPPGPVKPLVAVPTTAGTGAECTPVCVLDILGMKVKSGISHPRLRPALAVVDPLVTLTLPAEVTAASGMDVLCHALESWTARPYDTYPRRRPEQRVAYCGANPISDIWIEHTLRILARSLRTAVRSGDDLAARSDMLAAATYAGMGFGNAGVHIPHACAYPIAGRVRSYRPAGYPAASTEGETPEPLIPHGQSVSLTAPAAFRFTFDADPQRHLQAAGLLDPRDPGGDPRERLPAAVVALMRDIGIPNGIAAVGFGEDDVPDLVEGTLAQARLLSIAPCEPTAEHLAAIFRDSLCNW
ncbi:MAG: hydroxyacid-oxoacid transhydrogenase [Carbonactinosporaceae bacterium]